LLRNFSALCFLPAILYAQPAKGPVAAVVNGVEITEDELGVESQVQQFRKQLYDVKMRAVQRAISLRILEAASKESGLSVQDYIRREIDSRVAPPTEDEIRGFYLAQSDRLRQPLSQVRNDIIRQLNEAKLQQLRQDLADRLRAKSDIRILLEPPRTAIDNGDAPRRGPANAPVTITEFGDYQCPYCKSVQPALKQLAAKYKDKVAFVFKNYPLSQIHPEAEAAAEAAQCAREQGKFWEYHDALFAAPQLSAAAELQLAGNLGLNSDSFRQCVDSHRFQARVTSDASQGAALSLEGTPAFYVNGVFINGAKPASEFETIIDSELAAHK
jgi:protein-disulfide isomerase